MRGRRYSENTVRLYSRMWGALGTVFLEPGREVDEWKAMVAHRVADAIHALKEAGDTDAESEDAALAARSVPVTLGDIISRRAAFVAATAKRAAEMSAPGWGRNLAPAVRESQLILQARREAAQLGHILLTHLPALRDEAAWAQPENRGSGGPDKSRHRRAEAHPPPPRQRKGGARRRSRAALEAAPERRRAADPVLQAHRGGSVEDELGAAAGGPGAAVVPENRRAAGLGQGDARPVPLRGEHSTHSNGRDRGTGGRQDKKASKKRLGRGPKGPRRGPGGQGPPREAQKRPEAKMKEIAKKSPRKGHPPPEAQKHEFSAPHKRKFCPVAGCQPPPKRRRRDPCPDPEETPAQKSPPPPRHRGLII